MLLSLALLSGQAAVKLTMLCVAVCFVRFSGGGWSCRLVIVDSRSACAMRRHASRCAKRSKYYDEPRRGPTRLFDAITFVLIFGDTAASIEAGPVHRVTDDGDLVECTADECNGIGYIGNSIRFEKLDSTHDGRVLYDTSHTYRSKSNKGGFTVAELVAIIVKFERRSRTGSFVDGRIDRRSLMFDGLVRVGHHTYEPIVGA